MNKNRFFSFLGYAAFFLLIFGYTGITSAKPQYNPFPPFRFNQLTNAKLSDRQYVVYEPRNPYNIFINYELGMHCVGFDISYCCVIPPYNSIQAQAVRAGRNGQRPEFLTHDNTKLSYYFKDNSYSEGNKMRYWQIAKDSNNDGDLNDPNDNMANYVWTHLFIYKDLTGTIPDKWSKDDRLHVGREIKIPIDAGPSGKHLAGGWMDYAGIDGGNIVFTDTLVPSVQNVPLVLTAPYLWDALGLPLTAFYDSERKGSIRSITNKSYQPYQYAYVRLHDKEGKPVMVNDKPVEFFGTNPVDMPNCYACHSRNGLAATLSKQENLDLHEEEFKYWKNTYPDATEYMARLYEGSINILELHDAHNGTTFLSEYSSDAATNRLGSVGPVNCADCHGDNVSGNLETPRPGASGYKVVKAKALTEAIHAKHAAFLPAKYGDKAGRTQSCQICHPTHWQGKEKRTDTLAENPNQVLDDNGNPRFSETDVRLSGGGCYLRRDAHTNPSVEPPFFLNAIGKWYLKEVSLKDENEKPINTKRGLYCTHCHNHLTQELYNYDDLKDVVTQEGKTLRNKPVEEIIKTVANGDSKKFKSYYADPTVGSEDSPLFKFYAKHKSAILVKATKDKDDNQKLVAWNAQEGDPVDYSSASGGSDWWLAASEPHCANCHVAPFVESEGGKVFPIDQPNKYALFRYSKAHGKFACQSCHESIHGLYPTRYEGEDNTVDITTHEQALQFSPDGKYAGPVTCATCHTVNDKGVSVELEKTKYFNDYWASVVLIHFMRPGDEILSIDELTKKYPFEKSQKVVTSGWN